MMKFNFNKILFYLIILLCSLSVIPAPVALIGGFLFTQFLGHPFPSIGSKATSLLLKVSVIGLGFGMNVNQAIKTGLEGIELTMASIIIVLTLGYFLGKWLNIPPKTSHLVASGTAISGGSAIAAVAPTVNANEKEISVSLGVVFLLNSVALIIFPLIGEILKLSQHQFGIWCALAIHDTSSVVGAASAFGEEALRIATTVKLARALWIIPISFISAILFKSEKQRISIPYFIFLYILAMVINSYVPNIGLITPYISNISKGLLIVTLFLIGSSLSIKKIKTVGMKPLALGVALWFTISILSLFSILALFH